VGDWIGAGKSYRNNWNKNTPKDYWLKNKHKMRFHADTFKFLNKIFEDISIVGWNEVAKRLKHKKYQY
jgi:hypothetical protein